MKDALKTDDDLPEDYRAYLTGQAETIKKYSAELREVRKNMC